MDMISPLHAAFQSGSVECASRLIEGGAEVESTTCTGQTPLHYAVRYAPKATLLLLDNVASVETRSRNGQTALHWACEMCDSSCLSLLLERGSNPNMKDQDGRIPLSLLAAANHDEPNGAKMLVDKEANQDAADDEGMTALHHAVFAKNFSVASYLVANRADVLRRDSQDRLAFYLAASHDECPDDLWKGLGDINLKNSTGETYLHICARKQKAEEVENLLRHGAAVNCADQNGDTPLHVAMRAFDHTKFRSSHFRSRSSVVSLLLQAGADCERFSSRGLTSLQEALKMQSTSPTNASSAGTSCQLSRRRISARLHDSK